MSRILNIVMMAVTACWMTSCRVFEVDDDLYDISKEQASVTMQLCYVEHSEDMADELPSSYRIRLYNHSKLPNTGFAFVSERDGERFTTTLRRSTDTISYQGYMQPGYYRLLTYNLAEGISLDSTAAVVENEGGLIKAMPDPLFLGTWAGELKGGEQYSTRVTVRQRTKRFAFRVEVPLDDTLTYVSNTARLNNVFYRLDVAKDAVDATALGMASVEMRAEVLEGSRGVVLFGEANLLWPGDEEFASLGVKQSLTVDVRLAGPSGDVERRLVIDEATVTRKAAKHGR